MDGGHIWGSSITVSAAILSRAEYGIRGWQVTGVETCALAIYLGAVSSTRTITITVTGAANQAPVVSGSNQSFAINQQHAVTELFTASDADGSDRKSVV